MGRPSRGQPLVQATRKLEEEDIVSLAQEALKESARIRRDRALLSAARRAATGGGGDSDAASDDGGKASGDKGSELAAKDDVVKHAARAAAVDDRDAGDLGALVEEEEAMVVVVDEAEGPDFESDTDPEVRYNLRGTRAAARGGLTRARARLCRRRRMRTASRR